MTIVYTKKNKKNKNHFIFYSPQQNPSSRHFCMAVYLSHSVFKSTKSIRFSKEKYFVLESIFKLKLGN